MDERQNQEEQGPLPRTREAVNWWLTKWGRHAVVEGKEPMTREDVEQLIEVNGGTAEGLYLRDSDLRGAYLSGTNLQGADLFGINLQGADLFKNNLQGANLSEANLQATGLVKACLQGVKFRHADLQGANLSGANLQGADLRWANLEGAKLYRANLQGANLHDVKISPITDLEEVLWDRKFISVLERRGDYEAAVALYRRLKEWHKAAGMLMIAGEFHYREMEAQRKAGRQQFWREIKQFAGDFKELKQRVVLEWRKLMLREE